ncbi:hypothetical protein FN846DRAFT_978327 [Sphaerosporella brunnea]|uniref:Uncharacterized protein n=1 Tax=Sphaerosporella brunnea TaxID=1250544 RepID=A0A5J5EDX5_9PEZI|nr:hypothetical protein FN846DRAFT_978327 [Sphaerosporella brunnea]
MMMMRMRMMRMRMRIICAPAGFSVRLGPDVYVSSRVGDQLRTSRLLQRTVRRREANREIEFFFFLRLRSG